MLTEARGKARSRLISAVLRDFAYWPRGGLQLPALHLAISAVFILISSGAILFETSNIIRGGETNYIRATVSLYVSLYNIFVSLLSILGFASRD